MLYNAYTLDEKGEPLPDEAFRPLVLFLSMSDLQRLLDVICCVLDFPDWRLRTTYSVEDVQGLHRRLEKMRARICTVEWDYKAFGASVTLLSPRLMYEMYLAVSIAENEYKDVKWPSDNHFRKELRNVLRAYHMQCKYNFPEEGKEEFKIKAFSFSDVM